MATVSKKLVENKFKWFVEALGGKLAQGYNDVGGYALNYNGIYGGYNIVRIVNAGGGQSQPFGSGRRKASAFVDALELATTALEIKAGRRK